MCGQHALYICAFARINFIYFEVMGNINGERILVVRISQFDRQTKGILRKNVKLPEHFGEM